MTGSCSWPGPTAGPPPTGRARSGADLVLVGEAVPGDVVAAWSEALAPWQVLLVRDGDDLASSLRPLVARLAGRSLGVVMAGGGARAMTHIGFMAELEDAGVAVGRVAGCSLGAIVAGLYARGLRADEVEAICYQEFVRRRPFSDYTLPTAGLAKGRRAAEALRRGLGADVRIESLPLQFRAVSTDLLARAPHVHRSGLLAEAVIASCRLPVLFPPLRSEGRLLVDGGVLDNLPVGAARRARRGPAGRSEHRGRRGPAASGPAPAGRCAFPALGETLMRTMMISSAGATDRARAVGAFVVTPPSMGVGLLEFHQMDRMVEAGRLAARSLLEATGGDLI